MFRHELPFAERQIPIFLFANKTSVLAAAK